MVAVALETSQWRGPYRSAGFWRCIRKRASTIKRGLLSMRFVAAIAALGTVIVLSGCGSSPAPATASGSPSAPVLKIAEVNLRMTLAPGIADAIYGWVTTNAAPGFVGAIYLSTKAVAAEPQCHGLDPEGVSVAAIGVYSSNPTDPSNPMAPVGVKHVGQYWLDFSPPNGGYCSSAGQTDMELFRAAFATIQPI
jgi:hypothetical protein